MEKDYLLLTRAALYSLIVETQNALPCVEEIGRTRWFSCHLTPAGLWSSGLSQTIRGGDNKRQSRTYRKGSPVETFLISACNTCPGQCSRRFPPFLFFFQQPNLSLLAALFLLFFLLSPLCSGCEEKKRRPHGGEKTGGSRALRENPSDQSDVDMTRMSWCQPIGLRFHHTAVRSLVGSVKPSQLKLLQHREKSGWMWPLHLRLRDSDNDR